MTLFVSALMTLFLAQPSLAQTGLNKKGSQPTASKKNSVQSLTTKANQASLFLTEEQFQKIPKTLKAAYLQAVKKAYLEFETELLGKTEVAGRSTEQPFSSIASLSLSFLIPTAEAQKATGCLIGGSDRPYVNGKCTTMNNECNGQKNSFKCGVIFGEACISRTPTSNLSQRCLVESEKIEMPANFFGKRIQEINEIKDKYCSADVRDRSSQACDNLEAKASALKDTYMKAMYAKRDDEVVIMKMTIGGGSDGSITVVKSGQPAGGSQAQQPSADNKAATLTARASGAMDAAGVAPERLPSAGPQAEVLNSEELCQERSRNFISEIELSLNPQAGKATFLAAKNDAYAIWTEYGELKQKCKTSACKEILSSAAFDDEINPDKFDSTIGVAEGFQEDLNALGQALRLASQKPKSQRKASDLDQLIKQLGWNEGRQYAKTLVEAYLKDGTFEQPQGEAALVQLTMALGQGRHFHSEENYRKWLDNGLKKLTDEEKRIQNVYIEPWDNNPETQRIWANKYGKNLSSDEMTAAKKMKELVAKANEVTKRLKDSLTDMKTSLNPLSRMSGDCLKSKPEIMSALASYNKVRTRCGGLSGGSAITAKCGAGGKPAGAGSGSQGVGSGQ